jgi:hypothetical protein
MGATIMNENKAVGQKKEAVMISRTTKILAITNFVLMV